MFSRLTVRSVSYVADVSAAPMHRHVSATAFCTVCMTGPVVDVSDTHHCVVVYLRPAQLGTCLVELRHGDPFGDNTTCVHHHHCDEHCSHRSHADVFLCTIFALDASVDQRVEPCLFIEQDRHSCTCLE